MWLTDAQVQRLTKRKRPSAQMRVLRAMGVDFLQDGDGRPLVLESVMERMGGGKTERAKPAQEPNFGALHRVTTA